ncbi:MAG: methionyl-tRNA formyltransferase [Clostridia bacterium]|nr:methionyl-tRNA formyltransferase [Clostridia bacterium]
MNRHKIVFMGTGPFALTSLAALWENRGAWELSAVYTKAPKKAGRGMQLKDGAVAEFAREKNIPLKQPVTLRDKEAQAEFTALGADLAVVASYGLILPKAVLETPSFGCVNVHGSLLPAYRGAAPVQRAVMEGRKTTGVTLMQMDEGLDTGAMLAFTETPIDDSDTAGSVFDRLAELGAKLLIEKLPALFRRELIPVPQPDEGASYAHKIESADQALDFTRAAWELDRVIRGLSPVPGALCHFEKDGKLLKIRAARPVDRNPGGKPGEIVAVKPEVLVQTGKGCLELVTIQPEGKGQMSAADGVNGRKLILGDVLCP